VYCAALHVRLAIPVPFAVRSAFSAICHTWFWSHWQMRIGIASAMLAADRSINIDEEIHCGTVNRASNRYR